MRLNCLKNLSKLSLLVFPCIYGPAIGKENPDLVAEFNKLIRKSESMRTPPISDKALTSLHFIDKAMVDSCPAGSEKTTCARYIQSNGSRFGVNDGYSYWQKDYWIRQQKVPDPAAHGDYEFEQLKARLLGMQECHSGSDEELNELRSAVEKWKAKYKRHARYPEAAGLDAEISKEKEQMKTIPSTP